MSTRPATNWTKINYSPKPLSPHRRSNGLNDECKASELKTLLVARFSVESMIYSDRTVARLYSELRWTFVTAQYQNHSYAMMTDFVAVYVRTSFHIDLVIDSSYVRNLAD